MKKLLVHEVFTSIQCEGPLVGTPAVFIRLLGCNLTCSFCDTPQNEVVASHMTTQTLLRIVEERTAGNKIQCIVITGGEPMMQDISFLCSMLVSAGYFVQIETNGTYALPDTMIDPNIAIVCSPKNYSVEDSIIDNAISFKYLVSHDKGVNIDGLPHGVSRSHEAHKVMVGPMDEGKDLKQNTYLAISVCKRFNYRLNIQLHKILGIR